MCDIGFLQGALLRHDILGEKPLPSELPNKANWNKIRKKEE
jgi:hypothetical protein